MLMYSRLHPTHQGVLQICYMKELWKLPVMVVSSILRRSLDEKRHLTHLAHCGIKAIQLPPRLPIAKPPEVKEINIDYIFHGYNFLYGNSVVDIQVRRDPGVSHMPIFQATFDRGLTTPDQRYLIKK